MTIFVDDTSKLQWTGVGPFWLFILELSHIGNIREE